MLTQRIHGHTFFPGMLGPSSVVLDLGANDGRFSAEIHRIFGCNCISVEANAELGKRISQNAGMRVLNYAIAGRDGTARFNIRENLETSSLAAGVQQEDGAVSVDCRRLETLAGELGLERIDLIKMDIEGAEIEVLDACSDAFLQRIGQLSIEFHDFNNVLSPSQVQNVMNRLRGLGFYGFRGSRTNEDTIFINAKFCRISRAQFLWAAHVERNLRGIGRIVQRFRAKPAIAATNALPG